MKLRKISVALLSAILTMALLPVIVFAQQVSYAVVALPEVCEGEAEGVVIGMDIEPGAVATLKVVNTETGEEYLYDAKINNEDGIAFSFVCEQAGEYELSEVIVSNADGERDVTSFAGLGYEDICFSVYEAELSEEAEVYESAIASIENGNDNGAAISDALDASGAALPSDVLNEEGKKYVVMIDPGHDGSHAGARANGIAEETATLRIANALVEELSQYSRVEVHMTRSGMGCPVGGAANKQCLEYRAQAAKDVNADLFVSVHLNSGGSQTRGWEVYYPNSNYNAEAATVGANLAKSIGRQLTALGIPDHGIRVRNANTDTYPDGSRADYYAVIRHCKNRGIPGIIVEHAYITNSQDLAFCNSNEALDRLGVADATGIAEYLGLMKGYNPDADKDKIGAFVKRMYLQCLNRSADSSGFTYWTEGLISGNMDGAEVAGGFFFSPEYKSRNISNEDFVEMLYVVMLNRASDAAGKADWVNKLDKGYGRKGVFNGFCNSPEFTKTCEEMGIERGELEVEGRDRNVGVSMFAARLYTEALGRKYDEDGLDYWCDKILDKQMGVDEVATHGFLHSPEFINKKLSDKEYVEVLYKTFLGRSSDAKGMEYWLNKLKKGATRDDIVPGFSNSEEFGKIKKEFGL